MWTLGSSDSKANTRRYGRTPVDVVARYAKGPGDSALCKCVNAGLGGFGAVLDEELGRGTFLLLEFRQPEDDTWAEFKASVAWSVAGETGRGFHTGLRVIHDTPTGLVALGQLIQWAGARRRVELVRPGAPMWLFPHPGSNTVAPPTRDRLARCANGTPEPAPERGDE